jgi:benzoate/toluate 1,2-dioxygenase subunit alpha
MRSARAAGPEYDFARYIDDRPADGVFRVHRALLTDPALFDLEMRYIWETTWVFLGLETQVREAHDFFTAWIGRHAVVVTRDGEGRICAFLNTCRHRGARLCVTESGHRKYFVCPYHGWAYDSAGRNVALKDRQHGCYSAAFDAEDHDLVPLPRFARYKGLLFGSLNAEAQELETHLGESLPLVDLVMDQGERGMEFVPGRMRYTYRGNWKLQGENNLDMYHLTSTHPSFMEVVKRRQEGASGNAAVRSPDFEKRLDREAGMFEFRNGIAAIWMRNPAPGDRPLYRNIQNLRARVGERRAQWMLNLRNLYIYPSVQLADSTSLIIRTIRPLAVDKTEIGIFCLAPVGEDTASRQIRIRQHEDFFGASGMANPDDSVTYEDCQTGARAGLLAWHQGYDRGMSVLRSGADEIAAELGIAPLYSLRGPFKVQNETAFHAGHREWLRLMCAGAEREGRRAAAQR